MIGDCAMDNNERRHHARMNEMRSGIMNEMSAMMGRPTSVLLFD